MVTRVPSEYTMNEFMVVCVKYNQKKKEKFQTHVWQKEDTNKTRIGTEAMKNINLLL